MNDNENKKNIPRIVLTKKTPYKILDLENLYDCDGERLETSPLMFFCRCGLSKKKPFCDGSHVASGIDGEKQEDRPKDKVHSFKGERITIHDNRCVCSHDSSCVEDLPSVFIKGRKPWIDPDGASVEEIIAAIKNCPSGALSYTLDGVHYEKQDRQPAIKIAKDGPFEVTGGIILEDDSGSKPQSEEHYVLCRCGASKNKPFCDGSHKVIEFSDD
jgi:CDGSH-type Zn-finger protein